MLDQTGISVYFFTMLKVVVWIGVIYFGAKILIPIIRAFKEGDDEGWQALHANTNRIIMLVLVFITAVFFTGVESAYRPKTVIKPSNLYEKRLQANEGKPLPPIQEAPTKPSWKEVEEKNRAENEQARKEFDALPDAKKR